MRSSVTSVLVAAFLCLAPASSSAQLSDYSQNFDALVQADGAALSNDGWMVYGNVFDPPGTGWLYGYGAVAPNNPASPAFCFIAGTAGDQQLLALSDYNNQLPAGHAVGNVIESNVFQEQVIGAADNGSMWVFDFDAKLDNLGGATTALAFIKTLNPAAGWATTNFITVNMTAIPNTWNSYQLSIPIDAALVGQILQFGFANTARNNEPSGVLYDNVVFSLNGATPVENVSWGRVKALYR